MMETPRRARAQGLFTDKQFAAIEAVAFTPAIMKSVFYHKHPAITAWHRKQSGEMRQAASMEELRSIVQRVKREGKAFESEAIFTSASDEVGRGLAWSRERALGTLARERASAGKPAWFDRRAEAWVDYSWWAPVAFVDAPEAQGFEKGLEA